MDDVASGCFRPLDSCSGVFKNNNKELFQLRQRVVNKVEEARSGWHALNRENNSLIKRTQTDSSIPAELKSMLIEFLEGQGEAFNLWIADANALANDVQVNIGSFNEKVSRVSSKSGACN